MPKKHRERFDAELSSLPSDAFKKGAKIRETLRGECRIGNRVKQWLPNGVFFFTAMVTRQRIFFTFLLFKMLQGAHDAQADMYSTSLRVASVGGGGEKVLGEMGPPARAGQSSSPR